MSPLQTPPSARDSKSESKKQAGAAQPIAQRGNGPIVWPAAMKPHRGWLIFLLCLFGVWVGLLLWMYAEKVQRYGPPRIVPASGPAMTLAK